MVPMGRVFTGSGVESFFARAEIGSRQRRNCPGRPLPDQGGLHPRPADSEAHEVTLECAEDEDGNPAVSRWGTRRGREHLPKESSLRLVIKVALRESKPSDDVSGSLSDLSLFEKQRAEGTVGGD